MCANCYRNCKSAWWSSIVPRLSFLDPSPVSHSSSSFVINSSLSSSPSQLSIESSSSSSSIESSPSSFRIDSSVGMSRAKLWLQKSCINVTEATQPEYIRVLQMVNLETLNEDQLREPGIWTDEEIAMLLKTRPSRDKFLCQICFLAGHNQRTCLLEPKRIQVPKKKRSCGLCQDPTHTRLRCPLSTQLDDAPYRHYALNIRQKKTTTTLRQI